MTSESAWRVAWTWASEWWGTFRFWLTEVSVGLVAGLTVLIITKDLGWAAAAFGLGAILAFVLGLVQKAWTTWLERRRTFTAALISLARAGIPTRAEDDQGTEPTGPSKRDENLEHFHTYVDEQLTKLNAASENAMIGEAGANAFLGIARRTADGIRRSDSSLGSYLDDAIRPLTDDWGKVRILSPSEVRSVQEAVKEVRTLYDGHDPGYAPF